MLLDDLVYDPNEEKLKGLVQLSRGVLRFASQKTAKVDLRVRTPAAILVSGGRHLTSWPVRAIRKSRSSSAKSKSVLNSVHKKLVPQTFNVNSTSGANFSNNRRTGVGGSKMLSMISAEQTMLKDKAEPRRKNRTNRRKRRRRAN